MDDMRMAKYEVFIEEINSKVEYNPLNRLIEFNAYFKKDNYGIFYYPDSQWASPLCLIFEEDKLNDFARFIMKTARFYSRAISDDFVNDTDSGDLYAFMNLIHRDNSNPKKVIEAAKHFSRAYRRTNESCEGYRLIFWSLMILAVDESLSGDKLSLICDFARMLHISDDELADIAHLVALVFDGEDFCRKYPHLFDKNHLVKIAAKNGDLFDGDVWKKLLEREEDLKKTLEERLQNIDLTDAEKESVRGVADFAIKCFTEDHDFTDNLDEIMKEDDLVGIDTALRPAAPAFGFKTLIVPVSLLGVLEIPYTRSGLPFCNWLMLLNSYFK